MQDCQLSVLEGSLGCLQRGHQVTLVSVAATWGTSPRPVGALLAVSSNGQFFGSVSGGCIEEDLIGQLVCSPIKQPTLLMYGETEEERHRFGLPCGGVLQLVAEPFNDIEEAKALVKTLKNRKTIVRTIDIQSGAISTLPFESHHSPHLENNVWHNVFGPVWHLFIVGAGDTGRYLAELATIMGFQVSICDPRPDYAKNWSLEYIPLLKGFPDDELGKANIDDRTAIVTVAHDPRVDDMALLEALTSDAFYIGSLGSKVNNDARRKRLMEHFNFTPQQVSRLQGPVGLPLGSKTPPEIALAIMAEVTALKNSVDLKAQLSGR